MANRTRREEWQPGQLTGRGRGGGEEAGWCSSRGPARRPACGRFSLTMLMLNSPLRWRAWRMPCAACRRRRRRWPPGRPTGCTPAHSGQVVQQPGRSADGVAQRSCPPPHVGGGSQAAPTHPFATRPPPPHSSPAAPCSPQPLPPPHHQHAHPPGRSLQAVVARRRLAVLSEQAAVAQLQRRVGHQEPFACGHHLLTDTGRRGRQAGVSTGSIRDTAPAQSWGERLGGEGCFRPHLLEGQAGAAAQACLGLQARVLQSRQGGRRGWAGRGEGGRAGRQAGK